MLNYQAIEIFTSEAARYQKKPVADAVMEYVRKLKIAARCIVTRGVTGLYESGEVATPRVEILSFNMPVRIYIVVPAGEAERVLDGLNEIVTDGIIALHDLNVLSHRTHNSLFPRQLMVRDVMTAEPAKVPLDAPLSDAARLLLSSIFTGLPVVDEHNHPIGVITQGDLIRKGGLPLRLGLLAETDQNQVESVFSQLAVRRVADVMTSPAIIVAADQPLVKAVELMLDKDVKRLPVVDENGCLAGMLSRLDIFRTIMHESPDWKAFRAQKIEVRHLKQVGDILRRDTQTVAPETSLDEVMRIIDRNDIQRVAVVDEQGKLLGLISDRDLLRYFKQEKSGLWRLLARGGQHVAQGTDTDDRHKHPAAATAGQVMTIDLTIVHEDMLIEEAIALMIQKELKRLPVVDLEGRFKGMISRDSLLRTGFGESR